MESTREKFRKTYAAYRLMVAGDGLSPFTRFAQEVFHERLDRLPAGAHKALLGERRMCQVSKAVLDRAESILMEAAERKHQIPRLPGREKKIATRERVCSNIYMSALDRMSLWEYYGKEDAKGDPQKSFRRISL